MSQDRRDTDSNEQVSEPHARTGELTFAPVVDDVPVENLKEDSHKNSNSDSKAEVGFESVTIRSYLAEQFGVREVTTPDQPAAPVASPTDAKAELAKWRARVPKLASALKQRTEQVGLLESELARLQSEAGKASVGGPGLQARDEHIAALELKLSGLTTNYQNSEGNLRARDLELEDLRADLLASKQRWQSLTEALDGQVASTDDAQALLASATEQQSTLQAELKAATERQSVLQAELDALVTRESLQRTELDAATAQEFEQQGKLDAATERESALHENLNAATERESTLQTQFDALTEQESLLQAKFEAAVEREATQQAELEAQQQQLTEQGLAASTAQQALADLRIADALVAGQLEEQLEEQGDALQEALERLTNLDDRNEKLLETTELANSQLISLSADITRLQGELASQEQTFAARLAEQQQHGQLDTAQIQAEHSERLRDIHAQTLLVFEALERQSLEEQRNGVAAKQASLELEMYNDYVDLQQAAQGLMQQLHRTQAQLLDQQRTAEQTNTQQAEAIQRDANAYRQDLAEVTLALEAEISVLQEQLQLQEQQEQQQQKKQQALQASIDDEARPRVSILGEISLANEGLSDFEQAWSGLDGHSADEAKDTIRELERLLKIRNDELSAALAARVHFLPATAPVAPLSSPLVSYGPDSDSTLDIAATDSDSNSATSESATVARLHEQVNLARTENERLRQQLERTSAALLESDDLTQLKGVGGKMAEQLRELGISQFAQMAALDLADLEAPDHPLYNLRSRVERNGWIEQAKALVHPLTLYGER